MKKLLTSVALLFCMVNLTTAICVKTQMVIETPLATKYDIKIKNDSGDEVTVYNAGSGGSYRLQKNIVTTIKMEAGDKLYVYNGGKKGALLLTASSEMDGKVQLYSKL